MNRQQEEALEAARLAAMVGGQLKAVDQLRDGSGMPANRIDINSFIAAAKGQNVRNNNSYVAVDSLQKKAMEDALREAMMVPDPVQSYIAPVENISNQMIPMPYNAESITQNNVYDNNTLKNIEEKIEKIGNSLDSLLELIQITLNQNE